MTEAEAIEAERLRSNIKDAEAANSHWRLIAGGIERAIKGGEKAKRLSFNLGREYRDAYIQHDDLLNVVQGYIRESARAIERARAMLAGFRTKP